MSHRGPLAMLIGVIVAGAGNGLAWAQTVVFTPSFSVQEEYDDNILRSPTKPESDFLTALRPGLRLEVRDPPWYVTLGGLVRAELFAARSDLDNFTDNASGSGTVEFRPTSTFNVSLADTFTRSISPLSIIGATGPVAPVTGIGITGRFASTDNVVTSAGRYQITPLTLLGVGYSLDTFRSDAPGGRNSDAQTADVSLQRRFSLQDSGTFRYAFNHFVVAGLPDVDSHFHRVGLIHGFSPTIQVSAEGGAIFLQRSGRSMQVDVGGTVRYQQQFSPRESLSVAYDRSPQLAGRISGAGNTQSVTTITRLQVTQTLGVALNSVFSDTPSSGGTAGLRIFSTGIDINYRPTRALTFALAPTVSDNRSSDRTVDFRLYSGTARVTYQFLRWLSLDGEYRLERQVDRTGPNDVQRNVFFLGLTASDQFR